MVEKHFIKAEMKAAGDGKTVSFIASTEAVDRMGDIVRQDGWDLTNYKRNPVVLFGHDHEKPIGRAHNVRVDAGKLKADLEFADDSVDEFSAKIGRMVKAGFLNAVSVGFRVLEAKPIKSGYEFVKSELLEISVVSVPANQEAIVFAKGFMGEDEIKRVFSLNKAIPSVADIYKNRDNVIKNWNLGPEKASPLPDANSAYWKMIAEIWGISEKDARHQVCANCEYYNNTPEMMANMDAIPIDKFDVDGGGRGFCAKFDFICHSLRTCQAWEKKDFIDPEMEDTEKSGVSVGDGKFQNRVKEARLKHRRAMLACQPYV